ncbi:Crp/Fnr family transcriptional regulator, partial [Candidatus Acetothermia bacterium]|nr:Crp/Fnr family transcriptional regulator [Candidatus Acetothermia bacterium]
PCNKKGVPGSGSVTKSGRPWSGDLPRRRRATNSSACILIDLCGGVLVERLSTELSRLQERLFSATQPNAPAKLAHILLELAAEFGKKIPDGILIDVALSQAELAEMAGLARETVNLTLRGFESKGWIKLQKRKIVICEQASLRTAL